MKELKKSIITKQVTTFTVNRQIIREYRPLPGDVAIFEVIEIGKHKAVQGVNGNNCYLFPGDRFMGVFGNRYATAQFEGYVPEEYQEEYQILGQGGVVGVLKSMHEKFDKIGPTMVKLVGFATNKKGQVINTRYLNTSRKKFSPYNKRNFKTILSVGSSMDSGKTTTAAFMCRGLSNLGKKTAYIKLTGTVYAKDRSFVRDCGADLAIDFSTLGYPSTYMCTLNEILDLFETLLDKASMANPDYVVIEVADGLLQKETFALLNCDPFLNAIDGIMLSCGDSMSVLTGIDLLKTIGRKPMLVSGLFTIAPLLVDEARAFCEVPVFTLEDFVNANKLGALTAAYDTEKLVA